MDRRVILLGVLGSGLSLSACGFRPMYGTESNDVYGATRIRISPIPNRSGQLLHNALRDQLNAKGVPSTPTHRLDVRLTEKSGTLSTYRGNNVRSYVDLTATYALYLGNSRTPMLSSTRNRRIYYPDVTSATVVSPAAQDATRRGLKLLAEDLARSVNLVLLREAHG